MEIVAIGLLVVAFLAVSVVIRYIAVNMAIGIYVDPKASVEEQERQRKQALEAIQRADIEASLRMPLM